MECYAVTPASHQHSVCKKGNGMNSTGEWSFTPHISLMIPLYSLDGILTLKNSGCKHTYDQHVSTKYLNNAEKRIRCLLKPCAFGHDLLHLAEPCSSLPIYIQVISDIDVNHYLIILL